jgi:hypothetical protein
MSFRSDCTAPTRQTLTSPLALRRPFSLDRLDARDRRVEGLVLDLMVRARAENQTQPRAEGDARLILSARSSLVAERARGATTDPPTRLPFPIP